MLKDWKILVSKMTPLPVCLEPGFTISKQGAARIIEMYALPKRSLEAHSMSRLA